ncbi:MAG: hypothetical protein ABIL69_06865 [candidate division WOR-3 bacterium]
MISNFIKPLGIITYLCLLFAILTGLKVIKVSLKIHRLFAFVAIIFATIHALLVIYLTYF